MKKVYADVTIKISRIDRMSNFLINEAARENIGWTRIGFWVSLDCNLWYFRFGMYWDINYMCFYPWVQGCVVLLPSFAGPRKELYTVLDNI